MFYRAPHPAGPWGQPDRTFSPTTRLLRPFAIEQDCLLELVNVVLQLACVHFKIPEKQEAKAVERLESIPDRLEVFVPVHHSFDAPSVGTTCKHFFHETARLLFLDAMRSSEVCINSKMANIWKPLQVQPIQWIHRESSSNANCQLLDAPTLVGNLVHVRFELFHQGVCQCETQDF